MSSIAELLTRGESVLASSGIAEPRREAMSLLMLATKKDKAFIYARPEHAVGPREIETFDSFLERRAAREPLQYISGVQEFYGLEFEVTPDVLIPRPETEMVVESALDIVRETNVDLFCDIGTGSGCIAIAILHTLPDLRGVGLDVSRDALQIAKRNAMKHGVGNRLELRESNIFTALTNEKFALIVSNPPYVPVKDFHGLQAEVRDFEPRSALTDGSHGLSIIQQIVSEAPRFLSPGGHLLMEIGFDQSPKVEGMFERGQWIEPRFFPDLQGIPRLVWARLK